MNTLQKLHSNWMKNKTFKILEICTFRSLSVKFISETVKDRGNPSTHCRKLSIQFIQQQQQNHVKIGRKIKIHLYYKPFDMRNVEFETLLDPFLKLNSLKKNYGLSITYKNEHFAKKNALKLDENLESSIIFNSPFYL